ncbi:Mini-ribonuclease 3 [Desulfosporosinus fructosivorans]
MQNWQEMNALTLAYLGDAVYELWARTHMLELGHEKVKELHKQAVGYVRASTQALILRALLPDLNEVEQQVVMRGRNAKGGHPKNVDVVTYRHATAFESLVGYWHLNQLNDRLQWAFSKVDGIIQGESISTEAVYEIPLPLGEVGVSRLD